VPIEVFPLAALVRLMRSAKRPTYKVTKARKYWPGVTLAESIDLLLEQWRSIVAELTRQARVLGMISPSAKKS